MEHSFALTPCSDFGDIKVANACEKVDAAQKNLSESKITNNPSTVKAAEEALLAAQTEFLRAMKSEGLVAVTEDGKLVTDPSEVSVGTRQTLVTPTDSQNDPQKTELNFSKLASMLVSIFTPLISILVSIIGEMMGSEVVMGKFMGADVESFREILHTVWLIIRDFVNYLFIIVLLVMAFMSVFGAATPENNNFELKKVLPKFVLAVIGVNFTWFAAQVVLDAANVATHVVYAIPKTLIAGEAQTNKLVCKPADSGVTAVTTDGKTELEIQGCYPLAIFVKNKGTKTTPATNGPVEISRQTTYSGALTSDSKSTTGSNFFFGRAEAATPATRTTAEKDIETVIADFIGNHPEAKYQQDFGKFVIIWSDFNWDRFQSNSIAALFAYNILQVQNLPRSVRETLTGEVEIEDLIVNTGFALLFMIVTVVAFLVMAVVLIERIPILWMNIIFFPVIVLQMAMKDFGVAEANLEDKGIGVKPYIKFAFLPALMGLPLTLGYILILAGQQVTSKIADGNLIFETEIINGVHTVHQLLWYAIAVGVLWSSVGIAESTAIHLKKVVEGISGTAKSVGSFIAKLPLYVQFIPIVRGEHAHEHGHDHSASPLALFHGLQNIRAGMDARTQRNAESLTKDLAGKIDVKVEVDRKFSTQNKTQLQELTNKIGAISNGGNAEKLARDLARPENKPIREEMALKMVPHPETEDLKVVFDALQATGVTIPRNLTRVINDLGGSAVSSTEAAVTPAPTTTAPPPVTSGATPGQIPPPAENVSSTGTNSNTPAGTPSATLPH